MLWHVRCKSDSDAPPRKTGLGLRRRQWTPTLYFAPFVVMYGRHAIGHAACGYLGCQPARACGCTHGEDRVACTHMHPSSNLPIHTYMLQLLIHA